MAREEDYREDLMNFRILVEKLRKTAGNCRLMMEVRGVQAAIPQSLHRIGDKIASIIYITEIDVWETRFDGEENQFQSFDEAKSSLPS